MSPLFAPAPNALTVAALSALTTLVRRRRSRWCKTTSSASLAYSTGQPARLHVRSPSASAPVRRGMFHLFTHAFFKALLFLGAGSVIHATSRAGHLADGRVEVTRLPFTYWGDGDRHVGAHRIPALPPGNSPRTQRFHLRPPMLASNSMALDAFLCTVGAAALTALRFRGA